jgi:hypothetical protein
MFTKADKTRPFDTVGFVIDFESGTLDDIQVIEGFQALIDTGVVWHLQGSYGRTAAHLIETGLCHKAGLAGNA